MADPSSTTFSTSEFWLAIALTAIPGLLGGVTYGVSVFLKEVKAQSKDWPPSGNLSKSAFFSAQALSGMGGSLAAMLVTLWANRFPDQFFEVKAWLSLVCTGFVAGYVANRLLPAIADSLYTQMKKLAQQADATELKANEAKQVGEQASAQAATAEAKVEDAVRLASEMVGAINYLTAADFSQKTRTKEHIDSLSKLLKIFPTDANLNLLLARLYDEAEKDRAGAIAVLKSYVEAKAAAGEADDPKMANVFWNLSCYYEGEGRSRNDADLCQKAIEVMEQSLKCKPFYFRAFLEDEDFKAMRESKEGVEMLVRVQTKYSEWTKEHPDQFSE